MNKYKRKYLVSATFMDGEALQAEIPAMAEKTARTLFNQLPDVQKRIEAGMQIVQYSVVEIDEADECDRFSVTEDGDMVSIVDTFLMQECRFQKGQFEKTSTIHRYPGAFGAADGDEMHIFDKFVRETYPLYYGAL